MYTFQGVSRWMGKCADLFNQYVYIRHDNEIMNEYPSPDELDGLGYVFWRYKKNNTVYVLNFLFAKRTYSSSF